MGKANVQITFCGSENSPESRLECFANDNGELFISVNDGLQFNGSYITLDKPTAIRFSREIRRQIAVLIEFENKIKEG